MMRRDEIETGGGEHKMGYETERGERRERTEERKRETEEGTESEESLPYRYLPRYLGMP